MNGLVAMEKHGKRIDRLTRSRNADPIVGGYRGFRESYDRLPPVRTHKALRGPVPRFVVSFPGAPLSGFRPQVGRVYPGAPGAGRASASMVRWSDTPARAAGGSCAGAGERAREANGVRERSGDRFRCHVRPGSSL